MEKLTIEQEDAIVKSLSGYINKDIFTRKLIEDGLISEVLKIGNWYENENGVIAFFKRKANGKFFGPGFNDEGKWFDEDDVEYDTKRRGNWKRIKGYRVKEIIIKKG